MCYNQGNLINKTAGVLPARAAASNQRKGEFRMASSDITTPQSTTEEWRDIPGYEGLYQVSNHGRVRGLDRVVARRGQASTAIRGRVLFQSVNPRWGYMQAGLHRDGKGRTWRVHQLVALAFIGPNPTHLDVNHIDTDKKNNRADNLEYCTRKRNLEHAREHGIGDKRGEKHHGAKLTADQVVEIRQRFADGELGYRLAAEYGVARSQISRIVNGRRWAHVA